MNTLSMPEIITTEVTQPTSDLFGDLIRGASVSLTPYDIRCRIAYLEERLMEFRAVGLDESKESFPVTHHFTEGAYAREIFIPAGMVVIGQIHRHAHLNIISKGSVTVVTEAGGAEHLQAPCTMVSPVGTKRCLLTHEDTIWTTIHVTDETDIQKLEDEIITVKNYTELGMEEPQSRHERALANAQ